MRSTVCRNLVFSDGACDDEIIHVLQSLSFPPETFQALLRYIEHGTSLRRAGVSPHVETLVSQAHNLSWFSTQGVESLTLSQVGSEAGTPWATSFLIS